MDLIKNWVTGTGIAPDWVGPLSSTLGAVLLIITAIILDLISRQVLLRIVQIVARRSRWTWDDAFVESGFFSHIAHLAPILLLIKAGPGVFADYPPLAGMVVAGARALVLVISTVAVFALLDGVHAVYRAKRPTEAMRLNLVVQLLKIAVGFVGTVALIAVLFGYSPLAFLGGMGAFSAVLMLIFKDAILGFVAGMQLQANDLVRVGDWIEMPKYGADGDVIDVSLATVRVQNWDKTISSIPTYALISDSFRNWRGMSESGGRRIKRALQIDVTSIRFCDDELLTRFRRMQSLREYLERKLEEVTAYNKEKQVDDSLPINGRRLTNVGTFRAYLEVYLRNHPQVHPEMTLLVRQLPPGEHGLPIEIYVFSKDQRWASYESIQADIFDHIYASLPLFDLRAFQAPTGADVRSLARS